MTENMTEETRVFDVTLRRLEETGELPDFPGGARVEFGFEITNNSVADPNQTALAFGMKWSCGDLELRDLEVREAWRQHGEDVPPTIEILPIDPDKTIRFLRAYARYLEANRDGIIAGYEEMARLLSH